VTTFAAVLDQQLRRDPGRPLVTFYDDDTGERVELSVTTYANWVAKTSSLLVEELDLERGDRLLLDLPTHWLTPVFLGAAWTVGLCVVREGAADAVVCGPDGLDAYADRAARQPVVACALKPLGVRFSEPLPPGVHDFGVEVWSQPDAFAPYDPPAADDEALPGLTQAELLAGAAVPHGGEPLPAGSRLLTTLNPLDEPAAFVAPLVTAGSVVLWRHPRVDTLTRKQDDERATVVHAAE
jgi:uncharacterized protein (TIGR03089 family)